MYCRNCGKTLNQGQLFCSNCGVKQETQNIQSNNINSKKKDKLTKILGICAGVLYGLSIVVLFSGIIVCFPDPNEPETKSGLSFDIFGECAGSMIVISTVLVILIVVLNVFELNETLTLPPSIGFPSPSMT